MAVQFRTLPNGLQARIYACDPNLLVYGATALSFVDNIGSDTYRELAGQHGLVNLDPEGWYPVQPIFDLFNQVVEQENGSTQSFVAMGMRIAEQSAFPPEMKNDLTLVGILEGWQEHYDANHRGAPLPPVQSVKLGERHYQLRLRADHLYPFDLVYGMAYGFCRLLLPRGSNFIVAYDPQHSPYGEYGDSVIINIQWGTAV